MKRAAKFILILTVLLILGFGAGWVYLFHLGGIESIANRRIANLLSQRVPLDVRIGKITGDLRSGFTAESISIFYDDTVNSYLIADIARLQAGYSFSDLWNADYSLDYLHIDSANFTLRRDSSGALLLPELAPVGDAPTSVPGFEVSRLTINWGSIRLIEEADSDTFNIDNINLSVAVLGEDKTYAINVERLEFGSQEERFEVDAADGKLTYADKRLLIRDLSVRGGDTRIRLDGWATFDGKPRGSLEYAVDNLDLSNYAEYMGGKLRGVVDLTGDLNFDGSQLNGSVDAAGDFMIAEIENLSADFHVSEKVLSLDTLDGTVLGGCTIAGHGEIDFSQIPEPYYLSADLRGFNLKSLVKNGFKSDLSGHVELQGHSFSRDEMLLNLEVDLIESTFDDYPLHRANGRMVITMEDINFPDSFRVDYFENSFLVNGRIEYKGDMSIDIDARLANLDRWRGKLFIDQPGGRGQARAVMSGSTKDPDLIGSFISDSLWLYGLYSDSTVASFDIKRFLHGKAGQVQARFYKGTAWDMPYDSGYLRLRIDSNLISVDSAHLGNPSAFLAGKGILDYEAYPKRVLLDSLHVGLFQRSFRNVAPINLLVDSSGFNFKQAAVESADARLAVVGRFDFDESIDAVLSLQNVSLEPWMNLYDSSLDVDGLLSCEVKLTGTLQRPIFTLRGSVDSLAYRGLLLGNLQAVLDYDNQQLTIDSVLILSDPGVYRAAGRFFVDLAFTTGSIDRLPNLPMDVHFTASDQRFDLVSLILPSVEELNGDFFADFRLSGAPKQPHLEGEAYIKKAQLKYFDLVEPFYSDSAGVSMQDNRIIVNRIDLFALDGKNGTERRNAFLSGEIEVKSLDKFYYDLDVSISDNFPFTYELEDIAGVITGRMQITGEMPPVVTGDLTLSSMVYEVEFVESDEGSPIMAALSRENSWDLNLNVDIPSGYRIRNSDIDAEFTGQLNLIREKGAYRLIGDMEILRGKGFLWDKTFRIEPGSQVFFDGNDTLNPRLDIVGQTRVLGVSRSAIEEKQTSEMIEVCIQVAGTLEEPQIEPCQESSVAIEDILPLLVANYYVDDSTTATGKLEERLSGLISSQVSQIGSRRLGKLGVETFEFDPVYGGGIDPLKARLTVGFYTAANLYVYGRSALVGATSQEVGFEYRFSRNFLLQGERDEQELYHLNLKLHWEY